MIALILLLALAGPAEWMAEMKPATVESIKLVSKEFIGIKPFKKQAELFVEHLDWLNRGYSDRQKTIIVLCAATIAAERIEKEFEAEKEVDRRYYLSKFLEDFKSWSEQKIRELGEVKEYELRFFY